MVDPLPNTKQKRKSKLSHLTPEQKAKRRKDQLKKSKDKYRDKQRAEQGKGSPRQYTDLSGLTEEERAHHRRKQEIHKKRVSRHRKEQQQAIMDPSTPTNAPIMSYDEFIATAKKDLEEQKANDDKFIQDEREFSRQAEEEEKAYAQKQAEARRKQRKEDQDRRASLYASLSKDRRADRDQMLLQYYSSATKAAAPNTTMKDRKQSLVNTQQAPLAGLVSRVEGDPCGSPVEEATKENKPSAPMPKSAMASPAGKGSRSFLNRASFGFLGSSDKKKSRPSFGENQIRTYTPPNSEEKAAMYGPCGSPEKRDLQVVVREPNYYSFWSNLNDEDFVQQFNVEFQTLKGKTKANAMDVLHAARAKDLLLSLQDEEALPGLAHTCLRELVKFAYSKKQFPRLVGKDGEKSQVDKFLAKVERVLADDVDQAVRKTPDLVYFDSYFDLEEEVDSGDEASDDSGDNAGGGSGDDASDNSGDNAGHDLGDKASDDSGDNEAVDG